MVKGDIMKIKIKDKNKFIKENKILLYNEITEVYEVIAIVIQKKQICYLVQEKNMITLYNEKHFEIIDDKIPDYWIFKYFKYKNLLKNQKYMFSIVLDTYIGPEEFITNSNFFFDIYENPEKANQFLYDTLKKHGKEWKTPPQN